MNPANPANQVNPVIVETTDGVTFKLPFISTRNHRNFKSYKIHSREMTRVVEFHTRSSSSSSSHKRRRRNKEGPRGGGEEQQAYSTEENIALLRAAQQLEYQELIDCSLSRIAKQDIGVDLPVEEIELYMKRLRPAFQPHV